MNLELGEIYNFYGKIEQINQSSYDTYACNVTSQEGDPLIVRIPQDVNVSLNKIYYFETEAINFKEKIHLLAKSVVILNDRALPDEEKEVLLKAFYRYAPMGLTQIKREIESRLNTITNPVIKEIISKIYEDYQEDFYMYPAATKFHHAYISGLSYHTLNMMKLAEGFMNVYPFLNADLIYAGIFLHDLCKTQEFDSYEGSEYTVKGRLIGHIAMGTNLIHVVASKLNLQDTEEVMLLEHIIISHHYYGNFGSPKKPNIAEALVVHFVDNIDSKMNELGEELRLVSMGDMTAPIGVLDRERFYKHKLSK